MTRPALMIIVGAATVAAAFLSWSQSGHADASVYSPTRFDDPIPDGCRFEDCSLREAFIAANSGTGGGTVYLAYPGTYVLSRPIDASTGDTEQTGDLDVTTGITVTGSSYSADSTVIDANYIDRGIDVAYGASLYLYGVTVEHGRGQLDPRTQHQHGGGIHNHGRLTLVDSSLSRDCSPSGWGGGGLTNASTGTAILQNVTLVGDCAGSFAYGGGIENLGALKLFNVTISENSADSGHGGGLSNVGVGTARLNNTIVGTNSGGDCAGTIASVGHNLAGDGSCNFTSGGDIPAADPLFEQVLLNTTGEPFLFTFLPTSPAIDAGSGPYDATTDVGCPGPETPSTDEIGTPRPQDGNDDGVKRCDIGAFERPDPPPTIKSVSPSGGAKGVSAAANVRV
ncbi:MAG TPA: choice-of-anchor Q domain-containing protein, partial [Gaiellaceae bacterium]